MQLFEVSGAVRPIRIWVVRRQTVKNVEVVRIRQEVMMFLRVIRPEVTRIRYREENRKLRSVI